MASQLGKLYAYVVIPIAILMMFLLVAPLPRTLAKFFHTVIRNILNFKIVRSFTVIHVLMAGSAIGFGIVTNDWRRKVAAYENAQRPTITNAIDETLCKKWRTEREWWMALCSVVIFVMSWRLVSLSKKWLDNEEELKRLKHE